LSPLEYVRQSLVGGVSSLIGAYQGRVSPHKGFSCAYRVSKGRASCSAFGKRAVIKAGLLLFIPLLLRRFRKCSREAAALKEQREQQRPLYERVGCTWENCGDAGCDVGVEALATGACDCSGI
jgi:putative component of membrane protein insertase Oxa1/YidC/SpoIIIJ protein YidD